MLVRVDAAREALPWHWGRVLQAQRAGVDPLRAWVEALAAGTARQYACEVPATMPAAFVLQWALQVAAESGVQLATRQGLVVEPDLDDLSFALDPDQHYPVMALLRAQQPGGGPPVTDPLAAAHAAYLRAGTELALTYPSDAAFGAHQRRAMVADQWAMSLATERGEATPHRRSCCFIYVLPGVHECSVCPRLPDPLRPPR